MKYRKALLVVAACFSLTAQAETTGPYIGGSIGRNWQHGLGDHPSPTAGHDKCARIEKDQVSDTLNIFGGYRLKNVGVEIGSGKLFSSSFMGDCPWAIGGQQLRAKHYYGRINAYAPITKDIEIVPFVGVARVHHTNHEEFMMLVSPEFSAGTHLVNHTTERATSPLYGIGIQKYFDRWFVRIEYQRMERVAEDYWTARNFHNTLETVRFSIGANLW